MVKQQLMGFMQLSLQSTMECECADVQVSVRTHKRPGMVMHIVAGGTSIKNEMAGSETQSGLLRLKTS